MHRIDLHEVGAVDTACDLAHLGEIGKVADPPRRRRTHRVQLQCQPPPLRAEQVVCGREPTWRDDQGCGRFDVACRIGRDDLVIALRQIRRQRERRPPGEHTVDVPRLNPHVELCRGERVPRFRSDADRHRIAVRNVHSECRVIPLGDNGDRGQERPPWSDVEFCQGLLDFGVGACRDVERCEHRNQRVPRYLVILLIPTGVADAHSAALCELGQPVTHLIGRHVCIVSPIRRGRALTDNLAR